MTDRETAEAFLDALPGEVMDRLIGHAQAGSLTTAGESEGNPVGTGFGGGPWRMRGKAENEW